MTVSYSLSVSKATFGGFAKLLFRWKGSIFKSLWRESLLFCFLYLLINTSYRHALNQEQQNAFSEVVKFAKYFMDVIPFYFIVGFYVTTVSGRWISQFIEIPWPDRTIHVVASYVHGSDDRSRMIRRTLARYAVLLKILTYQMVSTAVRRRFPTTQHLVAAGIMTVEERSVFEKVEFAFGKWWLPCHWFTSLATRARKEGRIKDSILLKTLIEEMFILRTRCAATIGYDWISVPLAYTQVATIATYMYALLLLVGTQSIGTTKGSVGFTADYYFPFVTVWRFFFSVGWLKVAEQLLNPYGEDDDDFELNWTLDRALTMAYIVVDTHHMMHPRVKKDAFWDVEDIKLPQTVHSAKYMKHPDLGSALGLEIEEADYLPIDELCEKDDEGNKYKNQSMRKKPADRQNSSFIRRVLNSGFAQSLRRKSRKKPVVGRSQSCLQGVPNHAFSMKEEIEGDASAHSTPPVGRKSSQMNLVKKTSPASKRNSLKFRPRNLVYKKQKSYQLQETEMGDVAADDEVSRAIDGTSEKATNIRNSQSSVDAELIEKDESQNDLEDNPEEQSLDDVPMPAIPEEAPRANSLVSTELISDSPLLRNKENVSHHQQKFDRPLDLVNEVSEKLLVYRETPSTQERWRENESKGYESCCSGGMSSEELSEGSMDECEGQEDRGATAKLQNKEDVYVIIEQQFGDEKAVSQSGKTSTI